MEQSSDRALASPQSAAGSGGGLLALAKRIDLAVARLTEVVAAVLVVAEVIVLFAGVVSRYIFHSPILWTDNLASTMFLWLAMLGAAIALRRVEHMRFAGFLRQLSPEGQRRAAGFATALIVIFLLLLIGPTWSYFKAQSIMIMPELGVPDSVRAVALVVGVVLMLANAIRQIVLLCPPRMILAICVAAGIASAALWFAGPWLIAIGNLNLLVFFIGVVGVSIAVGVPIGFAFGLAATSYLAITTSVPLTVIVNRLDEGMSQSVLLAVPMFVFLGLLIEATGLARSMMGFLAAVLGPVRGGLNYVLLAAMLLVSGISGSKAADMAAIAPALFPEMKKHGAKPSELVALLSSSAAMADTIPPSLALIIFGSVTGLSISALFTAGLIPALVLCAALVVVVFFQSRRSGSEPALQLKRVSFKQGVRAFVIALPALILPFVIRGAVAEGVTTATEVSTIGVIYAFAVGLLLYRPIQWRRLYPALVETASLSGAILLVIGTATSMAWGLTQSGFSSDLVAMMEKTPGGAAGFMAITIVAFILLGNILEGIPAILLFGPLLLPVAQTLGIDEIQYAIVVIVAMSIGLFAPPFGVGFYTACAIGQVPAEQAVRPVWKYLIALVIGLIPIAAIPWLSTGLLP